MPCCAVSPLLLLYLAAAAPTSGPGRDAGAAQPTRCEVSSYAGTDSLHQYVTLVRTYNAVGLVVRDEYFNYQETPALMPRTGTNQYRYADTVLTKCIGRFEEREREKVVYQHDNQHRRSRTKRFSLEPPFSRSDWQWLRIWERYSLGLHTYDERGRRTMLDFPELEEQYTWTYDSLNRPTRWTSYTRERLFRIVDYTYLPDGWQGLYTFFQPDGSFSHLKTQSWEYMPQTTHRVYVNGRGQVTREVSTTEKGATRRSAQYFYDAQGRPTKTVFYDGAGQPELTHRYTYR